MSGHPFTFSSAPLRRVDAIQFGILSPEEIVMCQILKFQKWKLTLLTESNVCGKDRVSRAI